MAHAKEKKQTLSLLVIAGILILLALFLSWRIYVVKNPDGVNRAVVKEISIDRADVLKTPTASSTPQERAAFAELVRKSAVTTETLDITSCRINPIAISAQLGSKITLKNTDTFPHAISFGAPVVYEVGPRSSRVMTFDFKKDAGIYAYGCDNSRDAAGIILLW
jgi:hypothetical protein